MEIKGQQYKKKKLDIKKRKKNGNLIAKIKFRFSYKNRNYKLNVKSVH